MRNVYYCLLGIVFSSFLAGNSPAREWPQSAPLPNVDPAIARGLAVETPSPEQQAAVVALRKEHPRVRVDFHPVIGSPAMISAVDGLLDEGGGGGKTALAAGGTDSNQVTRAFLREHRGLFGFGPEALDQARVAREHITPHNGLRTVVWEQQVAGIAVFGGVFIAHVTREGGLVNLSSQFLPDAVQAAERGTPGWNGLPAQPTVTAREAVVLAARNVGETPAVEQVSQLDGPGTDAEQKQTFAAPALRGSTQARLAWLAVDRARLRLCWDVILTSGSRSEMFRLLVDARTGEVLVRHCLTSRLTDASYRVFTGDSPTPLSPGYAVPSTTQPPLVARTLVTLAALDTNASPAGWIPDGANETLGNNVDAHTDWSGLDEPDLPRPHGSPTRVFSFAMNLATQSPTDYSSASVVQLFYWCNWMHDRLYQLGFTEAAGNFQGTNFGRGGLGGDALQADAQDGSGYNNANFSTPPDGTAPRMQMFIYDGLSLSRDSALDGEVVLHEYTHGLSHRRVGGGVGLSQLQSRGLGEGWSDFYPLALLSASTDDLNGNYPHGAYTAYLSWDTTEVENYYFGTRRYPYSTDMSKNPLTFKDLDPAQVDCCSSGAPYNTQWFGTCGRAGADESHNAGEFWCVVLWEARARLIGRYGWAAGNELSLRLVTDGMNLAPPEANFVQARDAILQADVVDTGGANRDLLWAAFAKRGLGVGATSPASSTTAGVVESFDAYSDLLISPVTGMTSYGVAGGPFAPACNTYVLTNSGSTAFNWTVTAAHPWVRPAISNGDLAPGTSVAVQVCLDTGASALPVGTQVTSITFSNTTDGQSFTRSVELTIVPPRILAFPLDTDPGWTRDGEWAFGTPAGKGGALLGYPDPAAGVTGSNVFGVNLEGDWWNEVGSCYLTAGPFDFSGYSSLRLQFWRWLNVGITYDNLATIEVSSNGTAWHQVWTNSEPETDSAWSRVAYDISAVADGCPTVYVRWGLIVLADFGTLASGWNLDDVEFQGLPTRPLNVLLPSHVAESAGVLAGAGTVRLAAGLSTNLVISLTSSEPSRLAVPASVIIPAGQLSAPFDLTALDNSIQDGDLTVTVTAGADGLTNVSSGILVIDDDVPPTLLTGPLDRSLFAGGSASFWVDAAGKAPLSYCWYRDGAPIPGATTAACSLDNVQLSDSGSQFSCLVSNAFGIAVRAATLTVITGSVDRITFDDEAADTWLETYHNLASWNSFRITDATLSTNGCHAAMISSTNVVKSADCPVASIWNVTPFDLVSAYLTAVWNDDLRLRVKGYIGETLAYDNVYVLSASAPALIRFDYYGVTRVVFGASDGTAHAAYGKAGLAFAMDDLDVRAQPITVPSNDRCAGALPIYGASYTNVCFNYLATSTGDPTPSSFSYFGKGVWYTYTPTGNGQIVAETSATTFSTALVMYKGTCGALTQVASGSYEGMGSRLTNSVVAGTKYYFLAGSELGRFETYGVLTFQFTSTVPPIRPAIVQPALGAGHFRFGFPTALGQTYIIESSDSLTNTHWLPLQTNLGTGASQVFTNLIPSSPQRFFRLRVR